MPSEKNSFQILKDVTQEEMKGTKTECMTIL